MNMAEQPTVQALIATFERTLVVSLKHHLQNRDSTTQLTMMGPMSKALVGDNPGSHMFKLTKFCVGTTCQRMDRGHEHGSRWDVPGRGERECADTLRIRVLGQSGKPHPTV